MQPKLQERSPCNQVAHKKAMVQDQQLPPLEGTMKEEPYTRVASHPGNPLHRLGLSGMDRGDIHGWCRGLL